jgi:hypothetical protein
VDALGRGITPIQEPSDTPWGTREMTVRDPTRTGSALPIPSPRNEWGHGAIREAAPATTMSEPAAWTDGRPPQQGARSSCAIH